MRVLDRRPFARVRDMACVHASVCVESHLGQCLSVQSVDTQIWCVDNVGATWLTSPLSQEPSAGDFVRISGLRLDGTLDGFRPCP